MGTFHKHGNPNTDSKYIIVLTIGTPKMATVSHGFPVPLCPVPRASPRCTLWCILGALLLCHQEGTRKFGVA